ncbi:MAG TPA: cobalamin-binding protein [Deltaproteobacteria bacterium]|jgi:iron complex transport system substrate-binding protein|nr:cobalamin-binding protein [Deltaproteobacteria bacterium]HOI05785.1 cobalamin-binding protein [Deltaproteobacteria bacterium]
MTRTTFRSIIVITILLLAATSAFGASPRRIVSLAPSLTRQLYDLQSQEKLVGITSFCPESAKGKQVVGSLTMLNFEKILSLKPDLVLASTDSNKKNDVEKLRKLGLKVEVFEGCETFACMCREFRRLGSILGKESEADRIIGDVRSRIDALRAKLPTDAVKPRVFWQMGTSPLITASSATFTGEIISLAGGRNIFGSLSEKYPRINYEAVVARNPDVIFIVSDMEGTDDGTSSWSVFPRIKAVSSGRVHVMSSDLVCQPTPGMYLKALEAVVARLYPGVS